MTTEVWKCHPMTGPMIRAMPDYGVPPVPALVTVQPHPFHVVRVPVTTIEDLEHHAQALQLLMHIRGMGVVANVEQRIMAEAGAAWFAAVDLILAGRTVPKRWLKVIEAWQEDWRRTYPEVPEFPTYPIDDIVLMAVGNPVQKTVEDLEAATRQQLETYLQGWGFACYAHETDADLRRAAVENARTEGAAAPWPWRR